MNHHVYSFLCLVSWSKVVCKSVTVYTCIYIASLPISIAWLKFQVADSLDFHLLMRIKSQVFLIRFYSPLKKTGEGNFKGNNKVADIYM